MFYIFTKVNENGRVEKYLSYETLEEAQEWLNSDGNTGILWENTHKKDVTNFIVSPEGDVTYSPPAPTSQMVNQERDRRIAAGVPFEVDGKLHVFDFDQMGKDNITGAASLAKFAILAGAKTGDYRWTGGKHDFTWITQDNELVRMDAQTVSALGDVSANWTTRHIYAARTLKDMAPIPQDYADDKYWP
jgi:hypothetical protein